MTEMNTKKSTIMRRKEVQTCLGLARSTIYAKLDPTSPYYDKSFPRPFKLGNGARMIGWLESEIEAWVAQCANQRLFLSSSNDVSIVKEAK